MSLGRFAAIISTSFHQANPVIPRIPPQANISPFSPDFHPFVPSAAFLPELSIDSGVPTTLFFLKIPHVPLSPFRTVTKPVSFRRKGIPDARPLEILLLTLLAAALSLPAFARESSHTLVFDGKDRWDSALYDRNIDVDSVPGSARLIKTDLIADEMGNITDATTEQVSWNVRAKKEIIIEDPVAEKATLLVYTQSAPAMNFILEVNGVNNPVNFDGARMLTGGWARIDVNPKQLKKGLNTFILYPAEVNSLTLWIDNCRYPNRSARSVDGGASWDYDHLGDAGILRRRISHPFAAGPLPGFRGNPLRCHQRRGFPHPEPGQAGVRDQGHPGQGGGRGFQRNRHHALSPGRLHPCV